MAQQLLWLEAVLKLAAGLLLVATPRTGARLLGLPSADEAFWPRLLGGLLIGVAAGAMVEARFPGRGISLGGSVAINLAGAGLLSVLLGLRAAGSTMRGRWLLSATCGALALLALVEIAYATPR